MHAFRISHGPYAICDGDGEKGTIRSEKSNIILYSIIHITYDTLNKEYIYVINKLKVLISTYTHMGNQSALACRIQVQDEQVSSGLLSAHLV